MTLRVLVLVYCAFQVIVFMAVNVLGNSPAQQAWGCLGALIFGVIYLVSGDRKLIDLSLVVLYAGVLISLFAMIATRTVAIEVLVVAVNALLWTVVLRFAKRRQQT